MFRLKVTHYPITQPQVNPADRFGVANMNWAGNWWDIPAYSKWANFPMSCKMCDSGNTTSRGRNIPVSNDMWDFIHKLNNPDGIKFIESVARLIINRRWVDRWGVIRESATDAANPTDNPPDPLALAEPIFYPVNPYKIIDETPTHYRVDALVYDDVDWKHLDPKVYNWVNMPWLFPKMCAEKARTMDIQNVMAGVDAFWMTLSRPSGAWIEKKLITLAPDPTQYVVSGRRGVGYKLRGANWIMGLSDGSEVTVRKVTKAGGVQEFYGWHLNARSVIPPA